LGNDTTLCEGENLLLNVTSLNANYLWQNNSTDSTFNVSQYGLYYVNVTNICGTFVDSTNVNIDTLNASLGNDTSLCLSESLLLNLANQNAIYNWQNGSIDSTLLVVQAGTYWSEVTRGNCFKNDTINVIYDSIPSINLGNDTTLCEGENLLLNATSLNASYLWQDNSTYSTFNVNQSGLYYVNVTNICGTSVDSINVIIDTLNVSLGNDTSLCLGDSLLLNVANQNALYNWQNGSVDSTFLADQAGTYWCEVTRGDCFNNDTINVLYDSIPNINLRNDTILCSVETLLLSVTVTNSSYLWNDNSTSSTLLVSSPNLYWIEVTNSCGSFSDSINILYKNCITVLEIPNVFSPNGDNQNDLFLPIQSDGIVSYQLKIYNRWGQEIFYSEQIKHGWDGRTSAGKEVPNGTYFWIVKYSDKDGANEKLKGTVSLLR
jgi:gliding motility-associated-like protein